MKLSAIHVAPGRRPVDPEHVAQLAASMLELGLLNPIVVSPEGELVAGAHRLDAARALGWTEIAVTVLDLEGPRRRLAELDENLARNDLTALERGESSAERKLLWEAIHPETRDGRAGAEARWHATDNLSVASAAAALAGLSGVSERTVRRDLEVASALSPEVRNAIRSLPIADNRAELARLSKLPLEEQAAVVARLVGGAPSLAEARGEARLEITAALLANLPPPPSGSYRCIVVDPPWPVEFIRRDVRPNQGQLDYPTMSIEEIAALKLPAAEDCHLWLWTTGRFLEPAFAIVRGWGFEVGPLHIWHKPGGFQPPGGPQFNAEYVVFGRRGGLPFADTKDFKVCFLAPRRQHSRKPDEFFDMVRRVSPGPRLDMFSREERPGFETWGLEAGKFTAAPAVEAAP